MKNIAKKFLGLMIVLFVTTGCSLGKDKTDSNVESTNQEAKAGGVLNIGLSSNIASLDPIGYTAVYESNVMRSIFNTLVTYNSDLSEIVPCLASEWEISEDLTQYSFTIRDDVKFHKGEHQDGRTMTAEDIKFSLERSLNDSAMNRLRNVKEISIEDDTHLTIELEEPYAAFLAMLTDMGNAIVPKEEVEGWGDQFGAHPVGTGAFSFEEWSKDDSVTLTRHDNYWGSKAKLDGVKFSFIIDMNTMGNSIQSGDIHVATDIKGQNVELIEKNNNLELKKSDGLSIGYLSFNVADGPTKDLKVRQAMNLALDRDELVAGVYKYEEAEATYLPLPKASWGFSESIEKKAKDAGGLNLDKAKELMKEAGYENGFDIELYTSEARIPAATIVQAQMKKIGINIEIKAVEWGTFSETVSQGKAPLYIMGWSWYPDPDFFLYQMFSSKQIGALGNGGGYKNDEVDKLLNDATSTTVDEGERAKIYEEILSILIDDLPHLDLYDEDTIVGMSKEVQDYIVRPDGTIVLVSEENNVWLN